MKLFPVPKSLGWGVLWRGQGVEVVSCSQITGVFSGEDGDEVVPSGVPWRGQGDEVVLYSQITVVFLMGTGITCSVPDINKVTTVGTGK